MSLVVVNHAPDPAADRALVPDPDLLHAALVAVLNEEVPRETAALAAPLMAMISNKVY